MLRYNGVGIDLGLNRMLVLDFFVIDVNCLVVLLVHCLVVLLVLPLRLCSAAVFDDRTCCATITINKKQEDRRAQDATRRSIRAVAN